MLASRVAKLKVLRRSWSWTFKDAKSQSQNILFDSDSRCSIFFLENTTLRTQKSKKLRQIPIRDKFFFVNKCPDL